MKVRDLKLSGKATAWPPRWVEASRGETVAAEGVLEKVDRLGDRLLLQINVNGHRRTASLIWDPPPSVSRVEAMLLASVGAEVRDLADRELSTRAGGAHR